MRTHTLIRAALGGTALCAALTTAAFAQMGADTAADHDIPGMQQPASDAGKRMAGDMQIQAAMMKVRQSPETAGDKLFILDNACGNLYEVQFSRLVAAKAQDAKLKDLAGMIEKDHAAANEKLKPIAQKLGLDLPTALPSEKQAQLEVIGALPPEMLAKAYLIIQRGLHAKDATNFADYAKEAKDADLKAYINEVLPKLKAHGAHLNQVAKDMNVAASDTPADALKD